MHTHTHTRISNEPQDPVANALVQGAADLLRYAIGVLLLQLLEAAPPVVSALRHALALCTAGAEWKSRIMAAASASASSRPASIYSSRLRRPQETFRRCCREPHGAAAGGSSPMGLLGTASRPRRATASRPRRWVGRSCSRLKASTCRRSAAQHDGARRSSQGYFTARRSMRDQRRWFRQGSGRGRVSVPPPAPGSTPCIAHALSPQAASKQCGLKQVR